MSALYRADFRIEARAKRVLIRKSMVTYLKPREVLPPSARRCLARYGNYEVIRVLVGRHPIQAAIKTIANWLTLGEFEKARQQLGYDDVYHLYMLFEIKFSDDVVILKNHKTEVIVLQKVSALHFHELSKQAEATRLMEVTGKITLQQWFDKTAALMGDRFVKYDSVDANCQDYIMSNLEANLKHVPADIGKFISQDAYRLIGNNRFIKAAMRGVTDLAGWFNRFIEGEGIELGIKDVKDMNEKRRAPKRF